MNALVKAPPAAVKAPAATLVSMDNADGGGVVAEELEREAVLPGAIYAGGAISARAEELEREGVLRTRVMAGVVDPQARSARRAAIVSALLRRARELLRERRREAEKAEREAEDEARAAAEAEAAAEAALAIRMEVGRLQAEVISPYASP